MLKKSKSYFAASFETSGTTFLIACSNGLMSVSWEPMCICRPRKRKFFIRFARA